jgi:pSer/pThr/pTyr-binding forkhead associated (FHA) protein
MSLRELASRIPRRESLCPEQIVSEPDKAGSQAALLDQWGREHALTPETSIGRDPGKVTIAVLDSSVSRRHAELTWAGKARRWIVSDRDSTNGTFIEGKRISEPTPLADKQLILFGEVGFVLIADRTTPRPAVTEKRIRNTVAKRDADPARLSLIGPTPGGGGVVERGNVQVQLGSTQFALLRLLAERFLADQEKPAEVRGFVRTIELIAELPWDSAHPDDNHAKQMVRRVRKQLERLGGPELIESRHGFGYRLTSAPLLVGALTDR